MLLCILILPLAALEESETSTALNPEVAMMRDELHLLRNALAQRDEILQSLTDAARELRAGFRESEQRCQSLENELQKLQREQSLCLSADASAEGVYLYERRTAQEQEQQGEEGAMGGWRVGWGGREAEADKKRPQLEVNGHLEDKEGQTEWIYGVPSGRRKVLIELGANNGEALVGFMLARPDFWPIIVEPQPTFRAELQEIARWYGGLYIQRAAWVTEGDILHFHAHSDLNGVGSSLFDDSVYSKGSASRVRDTYAVQTMDVVSLVRRVARPDDYIVLRMDIEGAEYEIARSLVMSGVACWLDEWDVEAHALCAEQNCKYRPLDSVLPWLMRGCGVNMTLSQYYASDQRLIRLREQIESKDPCGWVQLGNGDGCSGDGECDAIPG